MKAQKPKGLVGRLVLRDILLREREGSGFGLYRHEVRTAGYWAQAGVEDPYRAAEAVDATILEVANELRWTGEQLHQFMDSKLGRWTGDSIDIIADPERWKKIILRYALTFGLEMAGEPGWPGKANARRGRKS